MVDARQWKTIQSASRCAQTVVREAARVLYAIRGAMVGRADKGLIITTGTFTADARREATRDGAPAIDLVDGEAVCGLLKDLKLGLTVTFVEEVQVDSRFFSSI